MAKGYWIEHMEVHDAETYDTNRAANAKQLKDFGAKFLVRGGQQQNPEGTWSSRTVIIEFASYADAVACYNSPDYQDALAIRVPVSDGNMVIVDHGSGVTTLYAHMSWIGVQPGDSVSRGQAIGQVGCTGSCTGPHVHFEVRVNGTAYDPMGYL